MAIANYYEQKPLIIFTFKKLCNGEQRLAAQHAVIPRDRERMFNLETNLMKGIDIVDLVRVHQAH